MKPRNDSPQLYKNGNIQHCNFFQQENLGWIAPLLASYKPDNRTSMTVRWSVHDIIDILNEVATTGVMWSACARRGLSIGTWLGLCSEHEEIEEVYQMARAIYNEQLQAVLHHRAINGVDEPVFYQGEIVGHVKRYSDRLLELQLKRHCPEYRDKGEVDVKVSGGIVVVPSPGAGVLPDQSQDEWQMDAARPPVIPVDASDSVPADATPEVSNESPSG